MSIYCILLHSLVLSLMNYSAVFIGYYIASVFPGISRLIVQVPVALVISAMLFMLWDYLLNKFEIEAMALKKKVLFYIYTFAFAFSPVLYVLFKPALSFLLKEFGEIPGIWMFQLAGNLVIVFLMIIRNEIIDEEPEDEPEITDQVPAQKPSGKKERKHKKRGSRKRENLPPENGQVEPPDNREPDIN